MKERQKQINKAIREAVRTNTTVPFDLRTLIESRASTSTIRKVYRGKR
jgi:hypothetical protein